MGFRKIETLSGRIGVQDAVRMRITLLRVVCSTCLKENLILLLDGTGSYNCSHCDDVILEEMTAEV